MPNEPATAPEDTAVRVALWRALHVEVDAPPHVFEDEVGLKLAAPDDGWRSRPDMSPFTRPFRASIVARARFIEDLVAEQAARGVGQYVILGAGLDTFAQRRPELASRLRVFDHGQPRQNAAKPGWSDGKIVGWLICGEAAGGVDGVEELAAGRGPRAPELKRAVGGARRPGRCGNRRTCARAWLFVWPRVRDHLGAAKDELAR